MFQDSETEPLLCDPHWGHQEEPALYSCSLQDPEFFPNSVRYQPKIVYEIRDMLPNMHHDPEKEFEDLTLHYIIVSHNAKKEKKCTLYPLRGRPDFSFRTKKDPGQYAPDSVLLFPGGEPLTEEHATEIKDTKEPSTGHVLEIVLIDSRWKKTNGILWSLPPMRRVSLNGYVTGAIRKDPPPTGGLASIEALFMASLLFGKPDFTLLAAYRFRENFFTLNGLKSV